MLTNKKSKVKRMRGTNSHGWGHKKKHRGAGHRGGKGLSGTGARGDAQKAGMLASAKGILQKIAASKGITVKSIKKIGSNYFGKRGFKSLQKKKDNVLSITYIENNYDFLVTEGIIVKDTIDTAALGYDKILGKGKFTRKITLVCNEISGSAKAQIEAAGGSVKVLKAKEEESSEE